MAPRLGLSREALCRMDPAATTTDALLVWKRGDEFNLGIVQPRATGLDGGCRFIQGLIVSGPRELRLLGLQMIRHAEDLERGYHEIEEVYVG